MSNLISLFCLVYGEPFSRSFEVEIKQWKSVSALRDLIISKDPDYFRGTSARSLDLWKINIPITDEETPQNPDLSNAIKLGPADKIAHHFNNPINENIHIIIQLPPPTGQLTERQLLMLRPLSLTYTPDSQRKKKTNTTTMSNWARIPTSVVGWPDFMHQASIIGLNDTTPQYDKPTFWPFEVSVEDEVQDALHVNVLLVLSTTIGSKQVPKEVFRRYAAFEKVQGKPDFILMNDNHLRLAIEVKTKWVLSVDDIVDMYHDNLKDLAEHRTSPVSVIDPIKQIYGYMGHNQLQYGVLSTYERTWFLWRPQDNPGTLFISDVVMNLATDPTLLQCFAYIMSLARHNHHCPSPPASPPPPMDDYKPPDGNDDDDGDSTYHPLQGSSSRSRRGRRGGTDKRGGSTNTGKRSQSNGNGKQRSVGNEQWKEVLRLEDFGWDSYDVIDVLGNGRCGTVFKAILRGEKVALKLCDLWQYPEYEKEMLTEVKTYMSLKQLQGHSIPKLKGAGHTAGGFFVIATEIAGSPIKLEELSNQERNEIVKALSDIHCHGLLHEDIRPENILIQRYHDTFRVMFIDFAFSKNISNKEEPEKEMAILKMMLGLDPTIGNGKLRDSCLT